MKIKNYSISGECKPLWSQYCIIGDSGENYQIPLIYLQRPKWVTDDARWAVLCKSIRLELPAGFELK